MHQKWMEMEFSSSHCVSKIEKNLMEQFVSENGGKKKVQSSLMSTYYVHQLHIGEWWKNE